MYNTRVFFGRHCTSMDKCYHKTMGYGISSNDEEKYQIHESETTILLVRISFLFAFVYGLSIKQIKSNVDTIIITNMAY